MKGRLLSATLALGLCAAFIAAPPVPSDPAVIYSRPAVLFGAGDSSAEEVGAAATVQAGTVRSTVALPTAWKLRSKSQLKVRTPTQVRCTRSGWKRAKAARRSVYVAVNLTCTAPADGAKRTVVLYKAKRKSQQLTVEITSPAPSPPSPPITAPAPGTAQPPPEPAPVRDQGLADDYAYLITQKDNPALPITWDKCTPIDVAVNMSSGPAEDLDLVVAAIKSVAATSGLPLRYAGPTSYMPTLPSPGPYPDGIDIVFAFASTRESSYLNGAMAGYGGLIFTGADFHWAVRGRAVIDRSVTSQLSGGLEGQRTGVYTHELGHAVGMGHAAGNVQLMYGTIGPSNTPGWGAGDRTGLATLGAQPCRTP